MFLKLSELDPLGQIEESDLEGMGDLTSYTTWCPSRGSRGGLLQRWPKQSFHHNKSLCTQRRYPWHPMQACLPGTVCQEIDKSSQGSCNPSSALLQCTALMQPMWGA